MWAMRTVEERGHVCIQPHRRGREHNSSARLKQADIQAEGQLIRSASASALWPE